MECRRDTLAGSAVGVGCDGELGRDFEPGSGSWSPPGAGSTGSIGTATPSQLPLSTVTEHPVWLDRTVRALPSSSVLMRDVSRQLHSSAQYSLEVVVAGDPPYSPGSLPQLDSDVVGGEQPGPWPQ